MIKRNSNKPFFRAAVRQDGVLEMMVYEDIGENYWDGGGITAKTVKQQVDGAGIFSSISLRINSPGGDAFEGVAIHNLLKSLGKPIAVSVDGIAASAASIIAMCGSTIEMGSNAMMMVHNAWTYCAGNAADLTKMADTLSKIDVAIAQTYVDRTGKPMADIKALMDEETWMGAEECVTNGFATGIMGGSDGDDEPMAMARKSKMLAHYRHVPKKLANKDDAAPECACDCQNCQDGECENCTNKDCDDANCKDCPMQAGEENAAVLPSNLSLFKARQWEIEHGIRA